MLISKKKLEKKLFKLEERIETMERLEERIETMEKDFYVEDYLVMIGEANGSRKILKSEAVEIKRTRDITEKKECGSLIIFHKNVMSYTSKENYENHKPLIKKIEKKERMYNPVASRN